MTNTLLTLCLALTFSLSAYSQDYAKLPVDVQQKMDQNKASGLDLFTGINRRLEFKFNLIHNQEAANQLQQHLTSEIGQNSCTFIPENKSVAIIVTGDITADRVKAQSAELFSYEEFLSESFIIH